MEWDKKVEMCQALNNGEYARAVEMLRVEPKIDAQAMDMFITGFDLCQMPLLKPIKYILSNYDESNLDLRTIIRLGFIKTHIQAGKL